MLSKVKSGSGRKIAHKCLVALADGQLQHRLLTSRTSIIYGYSNAINVPKHFPY